MDFLSRTARGTTTGWPRPVGRDLRFPLEHASKAIWLVQDADDTVLQPFYAALDGDARLCWTDDVSRAEKFAQKRDAERFAVNRMTVDVVIVRG
jgi:hypothetical protein